MAEVSLEGVNKQFGTKTVLDGLSMRIHRGERIGLIGTNGAGKTTLFRLIAKELEPDRGTVTRASGLQIGWLRQEADVNPTHTLHEEVGLAFTELLAIEKRMHDLSEQMATHADDPKKLDDLMGAYGRADAQFIAAGGHGFEVRMNEILGGLGFADDQHDQLIGSMSGGQKCRAALARLLLNDSQVWLLDEPTNHLDIDSVRWLEKFLAGHPGAAVVVSHDRYLLDRVCDRIVEIEHGYATSYAGNYSHFVEQKEIRLLTQRRQLEKDAAFIQKERAFIDKHITGQRTKEAQGRRTRLERRLKAGEFVTEKHKASAVVRMGFSQSQANESTTFRCDELTMGFGQQVLFENLSFQLRPGERFGITGPNGTGKTTLLRILVGDLAPLSGTVKLEGKVRLGYYAQEADQLDPTRTVLEEIRAAGPQMSEQQARTMLASYRFFGNDVFRTLDLLSGGERSRVRLATLILEAPDILVLDEPTNHLDIPSREVLEAELSSFSGSVIVVSHDRYFLDRMVNRLLVIRPDGHRIFTGNYTAYIEQIERERAKKNTPSSAAKRKQTNSVGKSKRISKSTPYDHLSMDELEVMLMEKEQDLTALREKFGDADVYRDPNKITQLREDAQSLEAEVKLIEGCWQERVDAQ